MSSLIDLGFKPVKKVLPPLRLILALAAKEKVGKTHFGLSASELGPLAYYNFDRSDEGVLHKFAHNVIYEMKFQGGSQLQGKKAEKEWKAELERFQKAYYVGLGDPKVITLFIDSGTDVWELYRLVYLGKLHQVMPTNYLEPNSAFRRLINDGILKSEKNIIWTHKMKEEWKSGSPTGEWIPSWFGDMPYRAQAIVSLEWRDKQRWAIVHDCRQNTNIKGLEIPNMDFPMLLDLVHDEEE